MRRVCLFALILCAFAASSVAQDTPQGPALWRIADDDTDLVIFGALHYAPDDLDWRSDAFNKAFEAAETVWFEAPSDTADYAEAAAAIVSAEGGFEDGETLSAALGEDRAARLAGVADALSIPIEALDAMRPWRAFFALSGRHLAQNGYDPAQGPSAALLAEARARGRTVRFLETAQTQLAMFTQLSPEEEADLLFSFITPWEDGTLRLGEAADTWGAGDLSAFDAGVNAAMRDAAPAARRVLYTELHKRWVETVAEMLETPGLAMLIVQPEHVAGERSLISALEAAGLGPERIDAGAPADGEFDYIEHILQDVVTE